MANRQNESRPSDFMVPKDPKELTSWLNTKLDRTRSRMPERQIKLNLAFSLGEQWLVWDQDKRSYSRPRANTNDPNAPIRLTINLLGGMIEKFISRLLKQDPEPDVLPVSDEPDDVDAARVGKRILQSELNRLKWNTQLVDLFFWVVPIGWSYVQVAWDPNAGSYLGATEGDVAVHEGNITLDIVPGMELTVDPNRKRRDMSDAKWAIRTISMTKEAAWEAFGVEVTAEQTRTLAEEVYDLAAGADHRAQKTETVKIHQFWLRPGSRAAPDGMVVTWAGDQVLEDPVPFPYKHGRLPFVQFDVLPGVGTPEGRTFVKDLVPMQADYNDARSREAGIRRTLVPKFVAPIGSVDPKRMTTRVEVLTYNPTGQPPKLEIPDGGWMAQYETAMNRTRSEMEDRAKVNEMALGTRTSAASIMAMQDASDLDLAVPLKLLAESVEHLGQQMLSLVRQFWTEDRIVRTWSEDGELEVEHFTGADIGRELDVRVSTESGLPDSKAGRIQLATELQQLGLLPDQRAFVRILQMPGMDLISESLDLDTKQQKREINKLIQGIQVPINAWDNHPIHWATINDFRKTRDYEELPPELRAIVDAHASAHQEQMLAAAAAQMGGPMSGAPGGPPPGASGPPPQDQPVPNEGQRESAIRERAGIGGPAEPGQVPGVNADRQAASMGG